MAMEELLTQFGYPALSLGAILEGEAALIIGGILAKQGYVTLLGVIAVAYVTTLACDQFFFFLGRTQGTRALARWPHLKSKTRRVTQMVQRHHIWMSVFFRFVYGIRSVTPFTIGLCGISPLRFLALNLIGISLWVFTLAWLGYLFGHALHKVMENIHHWELWALIILGGAALLLWAITALGKRLLSKGFSPTS